MDRTSWIVVIIGVIVLLAFQPVMNHFYPPVPAKAAAQTVETAPATAPAARTSSVPTLIPVEGSYHRDAGLPKEETLTLQNEFIIVDFTTYGGAIQKVTLLKHKADEAQPVILNRGVEEPILNLVGWTGEKSVLVYKTETKTDNSVTFAAEIAPGLVSRRIYTLGNDYIVTLSQSVENRQQSPAIVKPYRLQVGVGSPVHLQQQEHTYLGGGWLTTNKSFSLSKITQFDDGSILWIWPTHGKPFIESNPQDKISWALSESQFFVTALRPISEPGDKVDVRKIGLTSLQQEDQWIPQAVQTRLIMPGFEVPAGQTVTKSFELYAGPKEYKRLTTMGNSMNKIMGFGWLEWLSGFLLDVMNLLNKFIGNYGLTIIALTILIKGILWYPQSQANKSMRKMQLIAPMLKDVQEKYKDNPAKLQEEMMRLYKDYGVNPLGGCLPMLIQMPIFIGFYLMLQSSIEMRHEHFLWIADLSQPDTIYRLAIPGLHFPVNLMPILMAATMYWSMTITPQTQGVDNPSMKIMKFMPIFMLVICYNFSAALSLYWTMQNLIGVAQMYYNLKQPMPKLEKVTAPGARKKRN